MSTPAPEGIDRGDTSSAADQPRADGPAPLRDEVPSSRRPWAVSLFLALVVGAMVTVMLASHRPGHWWGDDWALYVRQAQSLFDGNPGEITADNHFTVDESLGAPFSPPLYPWGFPIILAPFVAVVGTDVDALAVVPVLCATVFACSFFALARRRVGTLAAFAAMVAATLTPLLLSWTELIQSEWPFLAVVFTMLVAIDRAIDTRVLVDAAARWWPLVALGVGAAAAFTVRREGFAMTPAIAAAQLALLTTGAPRLLDVIRNRRLAARVVVPHLSALATVYLLQWILPSTLVPQYSGTSIRNTWKFARRHALHLADVSGLKRQWDRDPVVLGSVTLGWVTIAVYLAAALAGIVLAVSVHRRRDLHLVAYALVAFLIGGSFRSALNRYLASVAPVLFLLGLVALASLPWQRRIPWGRALAVLAAALVIAGNVANANLRLDSAERVAASGAVEWGPTHPDAVAMFDVVIANSADSDVVAGPKARALTLMTDRRSIQVDRWRPLPTDWSPALVVVERSSTIEAQLRDDEADRYALLWSNSRFAVFEATD